MGHGDIRASPTLLFPLYSKTPSVREDSKLSGGTSSPCRSDPAGTWNIQGSKVPLFECPSAQGQSSLTRCGTHKQDRAPLVPYPGTRSDVSSTRDTESLFDLADLVEDTSNLDSPTHSVTSDGGGASDAFSRLEDFRANRPSFEAPRANKATGPTQTFFERKAFLSKDQMSLTPMLGRVYAQGALAPSSANASPQRAMVSPAPLSANASPQRAIGSPVLSAYAPAPLSGVPAYGQAQQGPRGGSCSPADSGYGKGPVTGVPALACQPGSGLPLPQGPWGAGPNPAGPGLRERVLVRRASTTQSIDQETEEMLSEEGVFAECLNFEDAETLSQDRELEKDTLDGISIVPLPCKIRVPNAPDFVLYALHFTSNPELPVLAGDTSTKLLFPAHLRASASNAPSTKPMAGRSIQQQNGVLMPAVACT
jgi:hypothetical protein